jgi:hypothetical protein
MSQENVEKNKALANQFPVLIDVAWAILGIIIISFDILDIFWLIGLLMIGYGLIHGGQSMLKKDKEVKDARRVP